MNDAMKMLQETSRTFFIPITRLKPQIQEAVASAYLCMRAIDEIEDHEQMSVAQKATLLRGVQDALQQPTEQAHGQAEAYLAAYADELPEVSIRLYEWMLYCPPTARRIVYDYTAKMSGQMADWVDRQWHIHTESDLDGYTYSVAGMVGELLSELWNWYDGSHSDRDKAVAFGRGLQAVNILRNRDEDMQRGVDFYPDGWENKDLIAYTRRNLRLADEYVKDIGDDSIRAFCKIPLLLAKATVKLIAAGGNKLTRDAVMKLVNSIR